MKIEAAPIINTFLTPNLSPKKPNGISKIITPIEYIENIKTISAELNCFWSCKYFPKNGVYIITFSRKTNTRTLLPFIFVLHAAGNC